MQYRKHAGGAAQSLSCVWLFVTPWTVACQVPLSMAFARQEYWSGLLLPHPGDLPTQESNPCLLLGRWILYHWAAWEAHRKYWVGQKVCMGFSVRSYGKIHFGDPNTMPLTLYFQHYLKSQDRRNRSSINGFPECQSQCTRGSRTGYSRLCCSHKGGG